jgi:hypothetical protein
MLSRAAYQFLQAMNCLWSFEWGTFPCERVWRTSTIAVVTVAAVVATVNTGGTSVGCNADAGSGDGRLFAIHPHN